MSECALDADNCVRLRDILFAFNCPIKEEHAWALAYQSARCYATHLASRRPCARVDDVAQVYIHRDGYVHPKTVAPAKDADKKLIKSERELIMGLGLLVYKALEWCFDDCEERTLSSDLEDLIDRMISLGQGNAEEPQHHEVEDEGIERDAGEAEEDGELLRSILQDCSKQIGASRWENAEPHYRAVCRALVSEALELSSFLRAVTGGLRPTEANPALERLNFTDWARFWVQVIGELRTGVQLKKVDRRNKTPIEYELTPYEMLMDDIRCKRYKLRKVADFPPRVRKDAHTLILDFIRSRPPLRKVTDRTLPSPIKNLSPHEKLLESIKMGKPLRKVPQRLTKAHSFAARPQVVGGRYDDVTKTQSTRRLIKVDFSHLRDEDNEDDDEDHDKLSSSTAEEHGESYRSLPDKRQLKRTAYDLATQCPSRRASIRRHGRRPARSPSSTSLHDPKELEEIMSTDNRLSLTLEEIIHIRSVLTKAELEALPVENHIKMDVEKKKVCFLCLKTRFTLFRAKGQTCKLCCRTICLKCCTKMRIPTEHFNNIPVMLLSPSFVSPDEKDDSFKNSALGRLVSVPESPVKRNCVGSAPNSPGPRRASSESPSSSRSKISLPSFGSIKGEKLRGTQMIVCLDCKMLVLQIIRSSRANRAIALRSLTLNLKPVY